LAGRRNEVARTVVVYVVIARSDGSFAIVRSGGDLPERIVFVFRSRQVADTLAEELNHAYITGWHDCLIAERAVKRDVGGPEETKREGRG
jgi:hypothetical protein